MNHPPDSTVKPRLRPTFRFVIGIAALIAASSLLTPYPAELVRTIRGEKLAEPLPPVVEVDDAPASQEKLAQSPSPKTVPTFPPRRSGTIRSDSVTRWQPKEPMGLPAVILPPFPPVLPTRVNPGNYDHFSSLGRGLNLVTKVNFIPGTTAAAERKNKCSFVASLSLDIVLPNAAKGDELSSFNPLLPKTLSAYEALMKNAEISPFYNALYLAKQNQIRKNAASLTRLLDRHNFYDTDTILEITAPNSGRKLLWMQADMDVISDGSDGDRLAKMPDKIVKSDNYQHSTSYRWKKRTKTPNPLLSTWETRLANLKEAQKKATPDKKRSFNDRIDHAKRVVTELKTNSFLIAEYDPFIVIPLSMVNVSSQPFSPRFGDYAVIIAGNRIFPAIVGDAGPRYKAGEASLRMAKAVNPKSDIYSRPVSDLSVSYLIFPNTAESEKGPIDYAKLNSKCRELLEEIGGITLSAQYCEWEDLLVPAPKQPNLSAEKAENTEEAQKSPSSTTATERSHAAS